MKGFPDDWEGAPHRIGLEGQKDFGMAPSLHIIKDFEVLAQLPKIDHIGGRWGQIKNTQEIDLHQKFIVLQWQCRLIYRPVCPSSL